MASESQDAGAMWVEEEEEEEEEPSHQGSSNISTACFPVKVL